ncbi:hypothetical protein BJ165DRAFT_977589 [Panaeolus papilionaceus]|nr:hypothetical protein BJ165DRAFT_977589 [Panaeolus papilionaceus]
MHHREPRSYAYDDQTAYATTLQQTADYNTNGYPAYDAAGHYYTAPVHAVGHLNDVANPSGHLFRSMTPSLVSAHRYPQSSSRDARFYNSQTVEPSSSATSSVYSSPNQYYSSQYVAPTEQRSPSFNQTSHSSSQFIPTPSQIAHNYNGYSHPLASRSPTIAEDPYTSASLDYSTAPHIVPSSHPQHGRPSRLSTGRSRAMSGANTSPTSATSPSGERYPCEMCGKTFSRSHDRKRHHETQHLPTPVLHRCVYCEKEFSRADSLKRHIDNGCDEMPS